MGYKSAEYFNPALAGVANGVGTVVISKIFTTQDPRFVVVTVVHTGTTGTIALFDSVDGFATEVSCQSMALSGSGGVTVLRYDAGTNGLLRNQLRVKLTVASSTVTVSSVVATCATY